jgi:hypothetical protein
MTVETTDSSVSNTGNGSATQFSFNFLVYDADHLFIYFDSIIQTTGFTITLYDVGGLVEFDVAPASGVNVLIDRTVPSTQLLSYQEYGPFPAKTNERGLDLGVMVAQQLDRELTRQADNHMSKIPLAQENNLVSFDATGDSKDSGFNIFDIEGQTVTQQARQVGDGVQTQFDTPATQEANELEFVVRVDGSYMRATTDYTTPTLGKINFVVAPSNSSNIDVLWYKPVNIGGLVHIYLSADYSTARAMDTSRFDDGDVIQITNSGIAGQFIVRTGTVTDNGGTLIVPTDDSNRYFEREYSDGRVNAQWFGASVMKSAADNVTAIQAAADEADNRALYLPGTDEATATPYSINAAIRVYGSLVGDGPRNSIISQTDDSAGILIWDNGTDFFTLKGIQCTYQSPTNTQTGTNVLFENEAHTIIVEDLLLLGGARGLHSDQVSFNQTYRNVRVQYADTDSIRIDGDRNDTTGAGTTIVMDNIALYNGVTGLRCRVLANLQINTIEVGTHSDHGINLDNCKTATIINPHFEVNDYAANFAKANIVLFSSNVNVESLYSQDNTATVTNYVFRIGSDCTLRLNGINRSNNTNQQLYYIDDSSGITSDRVHYVFGGYGIASTETGYYDASSSGVMSFPDFEEYLYSNTTSGATGQISQNLPSDVPGELSLHSVNSFIDDGDTNLTISQDRFGSSFTAKVKNISDGSSNVTNGITVRSVVKYHHSP